MCERWPVESIPPPLDRVDSPPSPSTRASTTSHCSGLTGRREGGRGGGRREGGEGGGGGREGEGRGGGGRRERERGRERERKTLDRPLCSVDEAHRTHCVL